MNAKLAKVGGEGIRRVEHRIPPSATRIMNEIPEEVEGIRVVRLRN